MNVEIHNLAPVNSGEKTVVYIATCREDCKDSVDLAVYDLVVEFNDVITVGKTVGNPAKVTLDRSWSFCVLTHMSRKHFTEDRPAEKPARNIKADISQFAVRIQGLVNAHHERMGFVLKRPNEITVMFGRKYARIVSSDLKDGGNYRSVHCFVDMTNGDILMSASWKAPAKHARGNIYNDDLGMGCVNHHSAAYLKR